MSDHVWDPDEPADPTAKAKPATNAKGEPSSNSGVEGRVPPHDLDAEGALLSAVMVDNRTPEDLARGTPSLGSYEAAADLLLPERFYSEAHRQIWTAVVALKEANKPVDVVTVATYLRDTERLAQVGGMAYLTEIINTAPAILNCRAYAQQIHDLHRVRRAILACQLIASHGYGGGHLAADFPAWAERTLAEYIGETAAPTRSRRLVTSVQAVYAEMSESYSQGVAPGMPTGFFELDDLLVGGLQIDNFMLVAARPGMGKSAFVNAFARQVAETIPPLWNDEGKAPAKRKGVVMFSVEMPHGQTTRRLLSAHSEVPLGHIRSGHIEDGEWSRLASSASALASLPIEIDDTPGLDVETLVARVRRLKRDFAREGVELFLVIVDYLQRLKTRRFARGREAEVSIISRALDELAKEEHLCVVAAAQLNRDVEKQQNKRPGLADLRDSGSLEQDADEILFLYRPEYYGEKVDEKDHGLCEAILAKNRHGSPGTARLRFRPAYTKFENL